MLGMSRGPLYFVLVALLLPACSFNLDATWPDAAVPDAPAPDSGIVDMMPIDWARDVPQTDLDAGGGRDVVTFCKHQALVMHLDFNQLAVDRVGAESPLLPALAPPQWVNDGFPAWSLARTDKDEGVRYGKQHATSSSGTISIWVRPDYDLSKVAPPGVDGGSGVHEIFYLTLNIGYVSLLHRAISDQFGRGVGLEVWNGVSSGLAGIWRGFVDDQTALPLPKDKWTHLVATYDLKVQKLQVFTNGILHTLNTFKTPTTTNGVGVTTVRVGGRYGTFYGWNKTFSGAIDELMLFSRVLSASEVKALYTWQLARPQCASSPP